VDDKVKACGGMCVPQTLYDNLKLAMDNAQSQVDIYKLKIATDVANKDDAVVKAQKAYDDAVANLESAKAGADPIDVAVAEAKVRVAEATLADSEDKLDTLVNGADPDDIKAAQVRIQVAQATLDSLQLTAPIGGEVLEANFLPGDSASQSKAAVVIADRSVLHVNVMVDESDVSTIKLDNDVTFTLDSLPGATLTGIVTWIKPTGETVSGLVKYQVQVDLVDPDPRVLLGMTADATIVTAVQDNALAVPLNAVQLDKTSEYVTRVVDAAGTTERVDVVSGQIQGDLVVVAGKLNPGDKVLLVEQASSSMIGPFGR
jgi:multidrug efflux pump subunit AcrA (membrane-fusion protein)